MGFYREIQAALLIDGVWVAADVRQAEPIVITRGGMDEQRRPTPAKCTLRLNNRDRVYSPLNPTSVNYRKLGINTPLLVRMLLARDEFAGTVSNGWSAAEACGIRDTTYPWTHTGGVAGDFNEAAGSATHLISAANSFRYSTLADATYADVGVLVECTVAINNITGGAIEPANILFRGVGSSYYMVRVSISTAEVLTVAIMTEASVVVAAAVTVTGVVDAVSSKTISVRAEAEGEILRVRVWKTGTDEPGEWHLSTEDRTYLVAGWTGIRSGVATGNTNTPVTFSYQRVEVYSPRFAGEVAKWPQSRSDDGVDRYVRIEAWDLFQRLKQGTAPLKSALRRGIEGLATPAVAYWSCEDGRNAGSVASNVTSGTGYPMALSVTGTTSFASNSDFDCSQDLPTFNLSYFFGFVQYYDNSAGKTQVRMLLSIPAAGDTNGEIITRVFTTGGTTGYWDLVYGSGSGGTITMNVYNSIGTLLATSGAVGFSLNGNPCRVSLELTQNGANIDWAVSTVRLSAAAGGISGTLAANTFGRVNAVNAGGNGLFTAVTVGHITVQNTVDSLFSLLSELLAFTGETAEDRVARLCGEQGITAFVGQGTTPAQVMGPQRPGKLLDLIDECPAADLGGLGTCRGEVAVRYDRLNYLYNQTAAVVLSLAGFQLRAFTPDYDNFLTRNKVTASRPEGSEYTATQTSGRLAALDPIDGGIGVYDTAPPVNVRYDTQLVDVANYLLLQGTIDQPRFPEIEVSFGTGAVRADETATRQLLDLNLWQRLQVEDASAVDLYDTVDLLVAGYTEILSRYQHDLTINTYPYDPYRITTLDSATAGRLDSDTTTLNEDLDTAETGVDVAITDGVLWSHADGDFDIMINGERMTVTAVSGSSSPQTFTVTRSVNGVVKTHTTGDQVHVADPYYLAGW